VWVPLLDGLERLGVVQLDFADVADRAEDERLHQFGALVAEIVMVKQYYSHARASGGATPRRRSPRISGIDGLVLAGFARRCCPPAVALRTGN
jgi:hypothetical protein